MKKFIAFISILIILLVPTYVIAVVPGTITCTDHIYYGVSKLTQTRFITYTVTFSATGTQPAAIAMYKVSGMTTASLYGWWIAEIDIIPDQPGPTDDTDFYLYRPAASSVLPGWGTSKIDVFGGNGVDSIDNATITTFNPATMSRPLTGEELLNFANNSVNDAVTTITFTLYR